MLKKVSLVFILIFLIFTIFYNGISTFINFGLNLQISPSRIAILRDGGWFLFVALIFLFNIKKSLNFIKKSADLMFFLGVFTILGILLSKFFHNQSFFEIIVGLKSIALPFFLLLSAIFVGNTVSQNIKNPWLNKILRIVLIGGVLWQLGKILFPDFFYSIGYGPIGDWHFDQNPPLYYRTGPGGWMRFSGFFAGPNNYGYFLILFFPYILNQVLKNFFKKELNFSIISLFLIYILSGVLTLSRGVLLGWGISSLFFIPEILRNYKSFLKKHKRKIIGLLILSVLLFIFLSYKKVGSTIEHFTKREEGINFIKQKPFLGYGLGTSGPAFHFGGDIIPENFYFQIWIDLGIFGLILRIFIRILIYKKYYNFDENKMFWGIFGLFFVGLFLHIWEDSMVNDLFFVIWGLNLGYNFSKKIY